MFGLLLACLFSGFDCCVFVRFVFLLPCGDLLFLWRFVSVCCFALRFVILVVCLPFSLCLFPLAVFFGLLFGALVFLVISLCFLELSAVIDLI